MRKGIENGLKLVTNAERKKRLEDMRTQFDGYMKEFEKVAAAKREQVKLIGEKLDPEGSKIRQDVEHLASAAAQAGNSNAAILGQAALQATMEVRLYVNKLIGRHDQAALDAVEKHFASLNQSVRRRWTGRPKVRRSAPSSRRRASWFEDYYTAYSSASPSWARS